MTAVSTQAEPHKADTPWVRPPASAIMREPMSVRCIACAAGNCALMSFSVCTISAGTPLPIRAVGATGHGPNAHGVMVRDIGSKIADLLTVHVGRDRDATSRARWLVDPAVS
jgi:hypothetical protein